MFYEPHNLFFIIFSREMRGRKTDFTTITQLPRTEKIVDGQFSKIVI